MPIQAYAAPAVRGPLEPYTYEPGPLGPDEVEIRVTHSGICHSDIHLIDNDWQISTYPLVPGHEIVGTVRAIGSNVRHVQVGQRVGVGWQSGACYCCEYCLAGEEPSCPKNQAVCCHGHFGGFAEAVRADAAFAHPIPDALASENAAPLLCAGITVYAPIRRHVRPGLRVGVIGVGGLGHLALQFAAAYGADVTAFSTTAAKEAEARQLGARHFVVSSDARQMESVAGRFDFLLSTVTVDLDWPAWARALRPFGKLCLVGASPGSISVPVMELVIGQKAILGSIIGGRGMMREMLQFAADHDIRTRSELMPMREINAAIERVRRNQARYRVVLTN